MPRNNGAKRKLLQTAIPTIFKHRTQPDKRIASRDRIKKKEQQEVHNILHNIDYALIIIKLQIKIAFSTVRLSLLIVLIFLLTSGN